MAGVSVVEIGGLSELLPIMSIFSFFKQLAILYTTPPACPIAWVMASITSSCEMI